MTVESGSHLGPYEILSAIGAGGMGEVYRARDKRLDRTIAVKVLAPNLSGNVEHRQRFEREARTVAALSHPHICPVYDIGVHDGLDYLVMEYLEGENLAARLQRGRSQSMRRFVMPFRSRTRWIRPIGMAWFTAI